MGYRSVAELFVKRVEKSGNKLAFKFPVDLTSDSTQWAELTWNQTKERVKNIALGLRALGIENEQRVAILSSTRIEWVLADLGIMCAGAACTTVYPSSTAPECSYILSDSDSRICFAENKEQLDKLVAERKNMPNLSKVILVDGKGGEGGWAITLSELEEMGKKLGAEKPKLFDEVVASVKPEHLATLIYTSGTTGKPKGVELLHDAWVFEGEGIDEIGILSENDLQYLWLPLSHSFGKVLEAAQLHIGFPTAVDGRIPKLVDNLATIRPTVMGAPPRIFEKVYNKIITGAEQAGGAKLKILRWALGVGKAASTVIQNGGTPGGLLALKYAIANKLVFSKIRARFGGRIRYFISGSAPLSRDMAEFFHSAGILILEGYGLTESSAGSVVNRPSSFKFGTVGVPLKGVEIKIAPEDGEILLGGRGIMRGYHNLAEETAASLEKIDGKIWLRTGDIGELDDKGRLRITDRKKDLIKTSGGKYVAPQALEAKLKAACPYLSQVVVHGDRRNFCVTLVTLDPESIPAWAKERGISDTSSKTLAKHPQVLEMVQGAIDTVNKSLASYESIKKFAILDKDFTIEDGELTPSMKVKRKFVEKKYAALLDSFYGDQLKAVS